MADGAVKKKSESKKKVPIARLEQIIDYLKKSNAEQVQKIKLLLNELNTFVLDVHFIPPNYEKVTINEIENYITRLKDGIEDEKKREVREKLLDIAKHLDIKIPDVHIGINSIVTKIKTEITEQKRKITDASSDVVKTETIYNSIKDELEVAKLSNQQLQQRITGLENIQSQLTGCLKEKEAVMENLQKAKNDIEIWKRDYDTLDVKKGKISTMKEQADEDLEEKKKEINKLNAKLSETQNEIAAINEELADCNVAIGNYSDQIAGIRTALTDPEDNNDFWMRKNAILEKINEIKKKKDELENEIVQIKESEKKEDNVKLEKDVKKEDVVKPDVSELSRLREKEIELSGRIKILNKDIKACEEEKKNYGLLKTRVKKTFDKYVKPDEENMNVDNQNDADSMLNDIEHYIDRLQHEVNKRKSSDEDCAKRIDRLREQLVKQKEVKDKAATSLRDTFESCFPLTMSILEKFVNIDENDTKLADHEVHKLLDLIEQNSETENFDFYNDSKNLRVTVSDFIEQLRKLDSTTMEFKDKIDSEPIGVIIFTLRRLMNGVDKQIDDLRKTLESLNEKAAMFDSFISNMNDRYKPLFGNTDITQSNFAAEIGRVLDEQKKYNVFFRDISNAAGLGDPDTTELQVINRVREMKYLWEGVSKRVHDAGTPTGATQIGELFDKMKTLINRGQPVPETRSAQEYYNLVTDLVEKFYFVVENLKFLTRRGDVDYDTLKERMDEFARFFRKMLELPIFSKLSDSNNLREISTTFNRLNSIVDKIIGKETNMKVTGAENLISDIVENHAKYIEIEKKLKQAGAKDVDEFIEKYSKISSNLETIATVASDVVSNVSVRDDGFISGPADVLNQLNAINELAGGKGGLSKEFELVKTLTKQDKTALIMRMRKHINDIELQFRNLMNAVKKKEKIPKTEIGVGTA